MAEDLFDEFREKAEKEMKKTKARVIYAILKEYENGATMEYLAQKYGITHGTISKWKRKYGTISENVPSDTENVPCSIENVPSDTEKIDDELFCLDKTITTEEYIETLFFIIQDLE